LAFVTSQSCKLNRFTNSEGYLAHTIGVGIGGISIFGRDCSPWDVCCIIGVPRSFLL